jgi:hypothetical protein
MQVVRVFGELLEGDSGASTSFRVLGLFPSAPIAHAGERDERGEVLVSVRRARDERGGMPVDLELRADDRKYMTLAGRAVGFAASTASFATPPRSAQSVMPMCV